MLGNDDACTEEAFAAYQAKAIPAGQVPFGTRLEWKRALFWSATYHHALAPKTMRTIAEIAACYFGVKYFHLEADGSDVMITLLATIIQVFTGLTPNEQVWRKSMHRYGEVVCTGMEK